MSPKQTEGKDAMRGPIFLHSARLSVRLTVIGASSLPG
jgi:hypothetical protein